MYRCVSKTCDENFDFNLSSHKNVTLYGREKEFSFRPRILLSCGHSVCEVCVFSAVTSKQEEFIRCDDCGKTTNFSSRTIQTIKIKQPRTKPSVRWNEDCEDDLLYEAFSIGAAFNSGRISISATPCVDLDENMVVTPYLPSHSYRNEMEVLGIRHKISNASESFKAAVADGISIYSSCGKSLKFLFDTKSAINKQFVTTQEAIRKRFHVLHGLLQLEEANLIRELMKSKENTIKSLQEKEKNIGSVRNHLKNIIMRSPQYAHIQSNNPFKHEIDQYRSQPLQINEAPEILNHLASLNKPHDDLHQAIKRLVDFRKAVRFDVNITFTSLISSQPIPNISTATENQSTRKKTRAKPLSYINCVKQQIVTIHDVKDSGYFSAHLPIDESVSSSLAKALTKWCSSFRHPPCTAKIKPASDVVVWHEQKSYWVRGKFKRLIEDNQPSEKENYYLSNSNLTSTKVEVSLVDYADEIYVTPIENLRESCPELSNQTTYPPLLKVWKCRLKNVQPLNSNLRKSILQFCASGIKVRLLILSEPIDDIYDVDIAHDIRDLVNPQPTLIEFLIYYNVVKLKDPNQKYPYQPQSAVLNYRDAPSLKIDTVYSVDVTFIKSPDDFCIVVAQEREEIESIEKKINELYASQKMSIVLRLYLPRKYIPCAARCELFWDKKKKRGKLFHRGYITKTTDIPPSKVEFFAVDYGETVFVPINELRILPDCYVSGLPRTAIKCSLHNIAPLDSQSWSQNAITAFTEFFQATDTPTAITVKSRGDKIYNVELNLHKIKANYLDGNINEILIQDGYAIKKSEAAEFTDLSKEDKQASSTNNYRSNNNRFDFNCYNLMQDFMRKADANNLDKIQSLIPVKITAFNSPGSFFVQINTPEVQMEINNYMKRLGEEYEGIDTGRQVLCQMQGFEVGEQCIYLFHAENGYSTFWRRGLIMVFLGQGKKTQINNNNSTDPRKMKQVSPDSLYKIRDRDYGLTVVVARKDMLQLQPASPYRKDGEKCLQVHISGIKHIGENWTEGSIDFCNQKIRAHHGQLFIQIEDKLTATQPEKLSVDCIYLSVEVPDACLPSEEHYYSLRYQLLESNHALLVSEDLLIEKEIKVGDDSVYANIKIPLSIRDDSLLSSLRSSFYTENQPVESIKYMKAKRPETAEFSAICTHIDDGPSIWFTILEEAPNESSIGTINKKILQTIMKQDKLVPFKGNAEIGRACTVHSGSRWHRAEIKSTVDNKITVCHVDTGLSKDYFFDKMSSQVFCEGIPKLALVGRLDGCVPFVESRADAPSCLKSYLTKQLIGKNIKVKWVNFGSTREMMISVTFNVENKDRDLKRVLLNLDLVRESCSGTDELPQFVRTSIELMEQSEFNFLGHKFIIGKFYPVVITYFVEENYFYLQLVNFDKPCSPEEKQINEICARYKFDEESINLNYGSFPHALEFNVGNSCCAKLNDQWFRGIVSAVVLPKVKYEVFFVDWGQTRTVELTNMRILPDNFALTGNPIFGFFVRLSNIRPARNGVWTQRLFKMMDSELSHASSFLVKFKSASMPFDVELWDTNRDQQPVSLFFSDLIDEGFLEVSQDN